MVGHPGSERVVLGAVSGGLARPLLGLVGPPPGLLARLARGGCRGSDGAGADAAATGGLGQLLELVGGLVDRLKMPLMLVTTPGRRHVGVPALGHLAPSQ